jgi:uncharacterized protein (UPF0332 family)
LSDAEGSWDADLSEEVVVNRCYYARFPAAQAALYDRGAKPESHAGLLSLFGSEVVRAGDVPRAHGRLLNRLSELRKQADYGYGTIDEDLPSLVSEVGQFVSDMETLCADG